MVEQKQLSLCVITKNEEAFLPGCLENMKETADEMLVADLGSGDRTCELAKQAGAAVYRPKWEDDFSKIKNFCMDHVSGKWVLFLQADEMIPHEQQKELKLLLHNPNAESYLFAMDDKRKEQPISSPAQFLRLLRNRKNYRFHYRSFEYIPDKELYSVQPADIRIEHRKEKMSGLQTEERLRLLQMDLEGHPQDSYVQYLYGIHLLNQGKYKESADLFERARQAFSGGYLYTPHLYLCYGDCLLRLGQNEKAEEVLSEGFWLFPFYSDLLFLRAELYHRLNHDEEATEDLQTCLALRKGLNSCVPVPNTDISTIEKKLREIRSGLDGSHEGITEAGLRHKIVLT